MGDTNEQIERAVEVAEERKEQFARNVAILVSVLAAALAVAEMAEKQAQNAYLTHHIAASDQWAFYQAKTIRADARRNTIDILQSLPGAAEAEAQKRIAAQQAEAARLDDDAKTSGRKQLRALAQEKERLRDEAFEHYHHYETVVGALQIGIVLASVSIVTRMRLLALLAVGLGGIAVAYGLGVAYGWA